MRQPRQGTERELRETARQISRASRPVRLHRYTRRGGNRALVELKPSETTVEPQSVAQEKDHQLRPESHVPTRQPAIVERYARAEATADTITRRSRLV